MIPRAGAGIERIVHGLDDTIAAIATAPGKAGLAVVRVSGAHALSIADAVFRGEQRLSEAPSHTLRHGWAVWPLRGSGPGGVRAPASERDTENGIAAGGLDGPGPRDSRQHANQRRGTERRIDEVVVGLFHAPRSYTREHVVEFSCHGGRLPAERLLAALLEAGARLARAGEFTLRAFLNGRIDLTQAEAVADLIQAETESAQELALSQLAGRLSRRLSGLSERLTDVLSEVEARVDFAEDVGGIEVPPHVIEAIQRVDEELRALLDGASYGRAIREGIRLPLVGRPNVGKSSLFNALVGEDRSIVTEIPGTTRDRVSESIGIEGISVMLSDTAGLRIGAESVEALGIARTEQALEDSPLVLWVVDGSVALEAEDRGIASRLAAKRVLVALNKRDVASRVAAEEIERLLAQANRRRVVPVSARRGDGLEELKLAIPRLLDGSSGADVHHAALSNLRHVEALSRARRALGRAVAAGNQGAPGEIVALELRESLDAIGEVTGRVVAEDLLDRIFSRFCIGK